jgi:hypothetical protein
MAMTLAGFSSVLRGMNATWNPRLLPDGQFALGVNVAIRDGIARTRPAFVQEPVAMPEGTFQGAGVWSLESGDTLVFVVSGYLYLYKIEQSELLCHGHYFSSTAQCWFQQVERYFIVQDGMYAPYILEQDDSGLPVRYTGESNVPRGTVMQYAQGRLHVVPNRVPGTEISGRPYFVSGDIMMASDPGNCLRFSENQYLSGGGAHGLPGEMGYIAGMAVLRSPQAGDGQGGLVVMGRRGASVFDVSAPRRTWASQQLSRVLFFDCGTYSPWSLATLNGEILYRALDGLRMVKRDAAGSEGLVNAPVSYEVGSYLQEPLRESLRYASCAVWDQYALATVSAVNTRYFRGILALDTAPTAGSLGQTATPAFSGLWTGLNVGQVVTAQRAGRAACFVFSEGVKLYRLDDAISRDGTGTGTAIESLLVTRGFDFSSPIGAKTLQYCELALSRIRSETTVQVFCRPVGYHRWQDLGTQVVTPPTGVAESLVRRLRFAAIPSLTAGNAATGEMLTTAGAFQVAILWTGYLQVDQCVLVADVRPEAPPASCDATAVNVAGAGTDLGEPYRYRLWPDGAAAPTTLGADAVPRGRLLSVSWTPEAAASSDWPANDPPVLMEWPDTSAGDWVLLPESQVLRSLDGLAPEPGEQDTNDPSYFWERYPPGVLGRPEVADGVQTRRLIVSWTEEESTTLLGSFRDGIEDFPYDWTETYEPQQDAYQNLLGLVSLGAGTEVTSPDESAPEKTSGSFSVSSLLAVAVPPTYDSSLPAPEASPLTPACRTEAPAAVAGSLPELVVYSGETSTLLSGGRLLGTLLVSRATLGATAVGSEVRFQISPATWASTGGWQLGSTAGATWTLNDASPTQTLPLVLTGTSAVTCGYTGATHPAPVGLRLSTLPVTQSPVQTFAASIVMRHPTLRLWTPGHVLVEPGTTVNTWFGLTVAGAPVDAGILTAVGVGPGHGTTLFWETEPATVTLPSGMILTVQVVPGNGILTADSFTVPLQVQFSRSASPAPEDLGVVTTVELGVVVATVTAAERAATRLLLRGTVTETGA